MSDPTQPVKAIITDRTETEFVTVRSMPWWKIIIVRGSRAALMSMAGGSVMVSLKAGGMPTTAALGLTLQIAAGAFLSSAVVNGIELLTKLDQSNPEIRA